MLRKIMILLSLLSVLLLYNCELENSESEKKENNTEEPDTIDPNNPDVPNNGNDNDNPDQELVLEIIEKRGEITEDETWEEGYVYYIADKLYIKATVTIQPGVIIKIASNKSIFTIDSGKIIAKGNSDKKILFTSKHDNTGGKILENSQVIPEYRDWEDIYIKSTDSIFDYCVFKYADEAIHMGASREEPYKITITNSVFTGNWTGFSSHVDISSESVIDNNRFYGNYDPMIITITNIIGPDNKYTSEDGLTKNTRQAIIYSRGYDMAIYVDKNFTLSETDLPYLFNFAILVRENSTFTIDDGVVLLMGPTTVIRIHEGSTFNMGDTSIITSSMDDSLAGSPTTIIDEAYYWRGIQDGSSSSSPFRANLDRVFFSENSSK